MSRLRNTITDFFSGKRNPAGVKPRSVRNTITDFFSGKRNKFQLEAYISAEFLADVEGAQKILASVQRGEIDFVDESTDEKILVLMSCRNQIKAVLPKLEQITPDEIFAEEHNETIQRLRSLVEIIDQIVPKLQEVPVTEEDMIAAN